MEPGATTTVDPHFMCTRLFDAPRTTLFRAFTDPDVLARWWGPAGFTNTFQEFTPAHGRMWRFVMRGPDGAEYPMVNEFIEIVPDQQVTLQHHQAGHNFRLEMTYADEGGKTRLTWRIWFESAEEAERVRPYVEPANEQNFDRLEAQLAVR